MFSSLPGRPAAVTGYIRADCKHDQAQVTCPWVCKHELASSIANGNQATAGRCSHHENTSCHISLHDSFHALHDAASCISVHISLHDSFDALHDKASYISVHICLHNSFDALHAYMSVRLASVVCRTACIRLTTYRLHLLR